MASPPNHEPMSLDLSFLSSTFFGSGFLHRDPIHVFLYLYKYIPFLSTIVNANFKICLLYMAST